MVHKLIGMWVLRRAWRLATVNDGRPLQARMRGEAKRILIGAAITVLLLIVGVILLIALLISLAS